MAEKKLSPELRFPEFEGEWVEKKLGSISSKIGSGKTPRGGDKIYQTEGIPFIRSQNVFENGLYLDETHIPEEIHREMKGSRVLPNDILLNITGGSIGRSCVVPEFFKEGNVNQHVSIIRLIHGNPLFLQLFLTSYRGKKLIFEGQTGSGREGLNFEAIKAFKIHFPLIEEQQKIASFLTAVDQRIQLLQKKKDKLEEYKKGVMQKLFCQEIRFKDENGNDFPDWEEKKLGDLYSFKSTNSFSREKLNYENGTVKNIHYGDIHTKFSTSFDITKEQVPFINPELNLNRISGENYAQEGDLVIADASENYADIGKTIELINLDGQKVLAGLHTFLARRKDNSLVIGFGGHSMKSPDMRKEIYRIAQGSKVLSISSNRLSDLTIKIPIASEQQKIASFLSSLDEKIEQVGLQIEKSQAWKKGLLHKMFV